MFFYFCFFHEGIRPKKSQPKILKTPKPTFCEMECLLIQASEMMNNAVETVLSTVDQVLSRVVPLTGYANLVGGCVHRRGHVLKVRPHREHGELACVSVPGFPGYLSLPFEQEDKDEMPAGWHSLDTAFLDAHLRTLEAQGEDTTERRMWLERDRLADYASYLEETSSAAASAASAASAAPSSPSVPLLTMPLLEDMEQVVTPVLPKASPVVPGAPVSALVCPEEGVRALKRTCLLPRFAQAAKRRRPDSDSDSEPPRRSKRPTKMPARYSDFL